MSASRQPLFDRQAEEADEDEGEWDGEYDEDEEGGEWDGEEDEEEEGEWDGEDGEDEEEEEDADAGAGDGPSTSSSPPRIPPGVEFTPYEEGAFVEVGVIAKAFGIAGELRVSPLTDEPRRRFGKPGTRFGCFVCCCEEPFWQRST